MKYSVHLVLDAFYEVEGDTEALGVEALGVEAAFNLATGAGDVTAFVIPFDEDVDFTMDAAGTAERG